MPLIPKKSAVIANKTNGQTVLVPRQHGLIPKKSAVIAANLAHVYGHSKKDHHLHKMITHYLKMFDNIINGRISHAISKYRCLQVQSLDVKEELHAKFQMKFSRAIIDRSIQLWRVTNKSMNVYISTMVDRLITDEIRSKSREQAYCKNINTVKENGVENFDIVMDAVSSNSALAGWLGTSRFSDAESDMMTQELWEKVLENLAKYEPEKLPILRKVLDPDTEVNFSSPSVHSLKLTIKAILEDLR